MAENQDNQEKIQAKYMEFQQLRQQTKQLNEHLEKITERIGELDGIIDNVNDLAALEKGTEILVPISNGVFIKAKTEETDNLLVNVGASSVVGKSKKQVGELLGKQKVELVELQKKMMVDLNIAETNAMKLQEELQTFIG